MYMKIKLNYIFKLFYTLSGCADIVSTLDWIGLYTSISTPFLYTDYKKSHFVLLINLITYLFKWRFTLRPRLKYALGVIELVGSKN